MSEYINELAFSVPATHDVLKTLFSPTSPSTIFEKAVGFFAIGQILLYILFPIPRTVFLVLFVIWRFLYNGLLGYFLREQSKGKLVVRWCKRHGFHNEAKHRSWWVQYLIDELKRKMGPDFVYDDMPLEFNSWLVFRGFVDVILVNDVVSYILFCFAYNEPVQGPMTMIDYLRYAGGVFMCTFNVWVKSDALRVVKDFAWYWGDFFFLIDASLVFDGVFEMAPHPMYSVGYMWFYGAALIAQSYWVLFVSLMAHGAQFAFLYLVENPHIEKTYNVLSEKYDNSKNHEILQLYFRRDLIVFKNFDIFRSSDLLTASIILYSWVMSLVIGPADDHWKVAFYVGQAVFWRFIHTYVLGGVLYYQSKKKFWTKHFIKFGDRPRHAFQHWKIIYNMTQIMTFFSFILCGWRLYNLPQGWAFSSILLRHTFGMLLILLHLWASVSVYDVIGDLGWFYGDFFIEEIRSRNVLSYTGIYRFLNNPEKIMGHAAFWGMTIICNSWILFAITLFGQMSTWLFVQYIETPHMNSVYGSQMRKTAGAEKALVKEVNKIGANVAKKLDINDELLSALSTRTLKTMIKRWESKESPQMKRRRNSKDAVSSSVVYSSAPSEEDMISDSNTDDDHSHSSSKELSLSPSPRPRVPSGLRNRTDFKDGKSISERLGTIVQEVEKAVDRTIIGSFIDTQSSKHTPSTRLFSVEPKLTNTTTRTIKLGDPIEIVFSASLKDILPKDWIGVYDVSANPSKEVTVSKSKGLWLFVSGHNDVSAADDEEMCLMVRGETAKIGQTQLVVSKNADQEKLVSGCITLRGLLLPWKVGTYELRYHHDGKYAVLACSESFDVITEPFIVEEESDSEAQLNSIRLKLLEIVEKCLDLTGLVAHDEGWKPLESSDNILEQFRLRVGAVDAGTFSKIKERVCKNLVYYIKCTFRVEFSWTVVGIVGTVDKLSERLYEAMEIVLTPK